MARVTILLGKGGTGRTTLARAMALNAALEGPATLLHADPTTPVPRERIKNLRVRVLDPYQIIEDAMARLVPLGPLTRSIVRHPAYQSFLEVAPGIKESAELNFLYGFLKRRDDRVFFDGPATGHGLHFLEAPGKLETILTGKVAERLRNVDAMIRDPAVVEVVLVALAEELPAIEVTELHATLEAEGFPIRGLVINRVPPPVPFETDPPPRQIVVGPDGRSGSVTASEALALLSAHRAEAERWIDELEALDLPTRIVPSLPGHDELAAAVTPFVEGFP